MGVITVKIRDEVEKVLRELAYSLYGGTKGSMSRVIEEGIIKLAKEKKAGKRKFRVILGGRVVFEGNNLDEIRDFLEREKLSLRDVVILAVPEKIDYRVGPRLG